MDFVVVFGVLNCGVGLTTCTCNIALIVAFWYVCYYLCGVYLGMVI